MKLYTASVCRNYDTWAHPPRYVMAMDINDFMVVRDLDRYPNVTSFLADQVQSGSLQLSVVVMGGANESTYKDIPVTRRFQYAIADGLVRYPQGRPVAILDHIDGLKVHNAILKPSYEQIAMGGRPANLNGESCCVQDGDVSVAAVYHYMYKSNDEYHDKRCHGRGDPRNSRQCQRNRNDAAVEPGTVLDDSAWRTLTRLVPKYLS